MGKTVFNYDIDALECYINPINGLNKVIKTIKWKIIGKNNGSKLSYSGVTILEFPEVDKFKPFEELTKADILSWLKKYHDFDEIRESIDQQFCLPETEIIETPFI